MSRPKLILYRGEISPRWEIPDAGDPLLIGWRVSPQPADAGVPSEVADALARGLCAIGTVAWFTAEPRVGEAVVSTQSERLFESLRRSRTLSLVKSRDPKRAVTLFDAPGTDWTLRGQATFVSRDFSEDTAFEPFFNVAGDPGSNSMDTLREIGVEAILLPGVDGDIAGLYSLDSDKGDDFVRGARSAGAEVSVADGEELFAEELSR